MNKMKLIKAVYENFYGYYGTKEIDLSDLKNTIGIFGRNGGGKSTFLESFMFVFYGVKKYGTLLDVYNKTAWKEEDSKCSVTFYFSLDGIIYRIYREINKKGSMTTRLYIDDVLHSKKREENESKIQEILKIPFELLPLTIFSKQREPHYFFTLDNPSKKKFFESFLQSNLQHYLNRVKLRSDRFEKKVSAVDAVIKSKQQRLGVLDEYLLTHQYTDYSENIISLENEKSKFEESLLLITTEKKSLSDEIQAQKEKKLILESSKEKLSGLEGIGEEYNLAKLNFSESRAKWKEDAKRSIVEIKGHLSVIVSLPDKDTYTKADTFMVGLRGDIETLSSQLNTLTAESNKNTLAKSKDTERHVLLVKSRDDSECPVCKSTGYNTDDITKEITEIEKRLGNYSTIDNELNARITETKSSMEKKQDLLAKALLKFDLLKGEYDRRISLTNSVEIERRNLKTTLKDYKAGWKGYRGIHKKYSLSKQELIPNLKAQITELEEALKRDISGRWDTLMSEEKSIGTSIAKCVDDIKIFTTKKMDSLQVKVLREEYQKELLSIKKYISKGMQLLQRLNAKIVALVEIKFVINKSFGEYVQKSVANIFSIQNTMLEELNSGIRIIPQITVSDSRFDFGFTYYINAVEVPGVSGGQETLLGISFRTALWKFLCVLIPNPISFCFLDEIFEGLDQDNASMLLNYIKSLNQYFDYIFITSHTDHLLETENGLKMS
jgi:DNA repair exonuclease SbcCD ATPase subunit